MKPHVNPTSATPRRKLYGVGGVREPRQRSLRDTAYEAIKRRIMTCAFRPGETINEVQVASMIGIGRTPVHQALDRLMLEDMVEVIPRKGVIVKPLSLNDIMQMVEVRLINETYCAKLAAERVDATQIEQISQIMRKAKKAIGSKDIKEMMLLDGEFHHALASAARNEELVKILRKLNERSMRFWFISFTTPDHHNDFQAQHEAIFEALRDHAPAAAEEAMRSHIESFRKSVMRFL